MTAKQKLDLDPEQPVATMICIACKQPLYRVTVTGKFSHEFKPAKGIPPFNNKDPNCPLCGKVYYKAPQAPGDEPKYRMVAPNGKQFLL